MKRSSAIALFFCFLLCGAAACAQGTATACKDDFDGDGKKEQAVISQVKEDGNFLLTVEGASIRGKLENGEAEIVRTCDINSADMFREIEVHTSGPSDDHESLFYRYDGKTIVETGRIFGTCEAAGNGIILADQWMGFWTKNEKFVLDKITKKLKPVAQEFYFVGIDAKVRESFPLYRTRTSREIVANLMEGSTMLIVACDPSSKDLNAHWYLIKSKTGIMGWARISSFQDKVEGLPWAD